MRERRGTPTAGRLTVACLLAMICLGAGAANAGAELIQFDGIRIGVDARLSPRELPRQGEAPVRLSFSTRISPAQGARLPRLRTIELAINGNGRLDPTAFPVCSRGAISATTTAAALAACPDSVIGSGHFTAKVFLPEQASFPSSGRVVAFNGRFHGSPAILAHVYGTSPAPVSFILPFAITRRAGTFATVLRAYLPAVTARSGYLTSLALNIGAVRRSGGELRSYALAGCPARPGSSGALIPLARASFGFADGRNLRGRLARGCRALP